MKKNEIVFRRLSDNALLFSLYINVVMILFQFISTNTIFFYSCSFVISTFVIYFFNLKNKEIETNVFSISCDLEDITFLFNKNGLVLLKTIGDYYVYKTKNILSPNAQIYVKVNGKNCTILTSNIGIDWIKKGLEEVKKEY